MAMMMAGNWLTIDRATSSNALLRVTLPPHPTRVELLKAQASSSEGRQENSEPGDENTGETLVGSPGEIEAPLNAGNAGQVEQRPPPLTRVNGLIPLTFDLASPGSGGESVGADAIVVRKSLRIRGRDVGSLMVHIDSDTRLLIDGEQLKRVLAAAGEPRNLRLSQRTDNLLTFTELRNDGVDLRYDPGSDSLVMTTG